MPEALGQFREAAALLRQHDPGRVLAWCLSGVAHASALVGDTVAAEAALTSARPTARGGQGVGTRAPAGPGVGPDGRGGGTAARRLALEAADLAAAYGDGRSRWSRSTTLVRLGGVADVPERLLRPPATVDGRFAPLAADHATALA